MADESDWEPIMKESDWEPIKKPAPTALDQLRASPTLMVGPAFQGFAEGVYGIGQLGAHTGQALSELSGGLGRPVKGSRTKQAAPNSLASALRATADYIDAHVDQERKDYMESAERVAESSSSPDYIRGEQRVQELGGSLFNPAGRMALEVKAGLPALRALLKHFSGGAIFGATQPVYGVEGDEGKYWTQKGEQSAIGGVTGAVGGKIVDRLSRVKPLVPTSERLKQLAGDYYEDAHGTGATLPKADLEKAIYDAEQEARTGPDALYRPEQHPKATTALDVVRKDLAALGPEVSFKDIDVSRRIMRRVLSSPEKEERAVAYRIIDGIDDFVKSLDAQEGTDLAKARDFYARGARLETIERAVEKAENKAGDDSLIGKLIPAGSHQARTKFDNNIRNELEKILKNDRARRQFNAEELAAIRQVVRGTTAQNLARQFGRVDPLTGGPIPVGGEIAGIGFGALHSPEALALSLGLGGVGVVGQRTADSIARENVDLLKILIGNGGGRKPIAGPRGTPEPLIYSSPMPPGAVPPGETPSGAPAGLINTPEAAAGETVAVPPPLLPGERRGPKDVSYEDLAGARPVTAAEQEGLLPPIKGPDVIEPAYSYLKPGKEATGLFEKHFDPAATVDTVIANVAKEYPDVARQVAENQYKMDNAYPKSTHLTVEQGGYKMPDGKSYTPEREAIQWGILRRIFTPEAIARARPKDGQPWIVFLGGRGGSGKTWMTKDGKVFDPDNAIVLNSDTIKEMFPEYQGWNAGQLHEESTDVLAMADELARHYKINVIYDATLKSPKDAVKRLADFQKAGYKSAGYYMHLPPQTAAERVLGRMMRELAEGKPGRFVPPDLTLKSHTNEQTFDGLKPKFDDWAIYENTGDKPRLVARKGQ